MEQETKQHRKSTPRYNSKKESRNEEGKLVREIRLGENMTQEQFANMVGVDIQSIAHTETGRNNLSLKLVQKICDALDISVDYFLKRTDNRKSHRLSANYDTDKELSDLRKQIKILEQNIAEILTKSTEMEQSIKTLSNHPLLN